MKKRWFGLHPTVIFLGLTSFFNDLSSEMIYPLLPVFLTTVIGAPMAFVGVIEGMAETTASILKLFSGYLADRIGKKRALTLAGYSISNFIRPLIGLAGSSLTVFALRFVDRVGKGVRTSPRDALVASVTEPENRGKAFGYHRSMDHFGAFVGAAVAWVLLRWAGLEMRTVFFLVLIPGILSVLSLVLGVRGADDPPPAGAKPPVLSLKPFDKPFKFYLVVLVLFTLGNSSDAFLLLKAKEAGFDTMDLPLLWMALHVVKAVLSTPAGMLSDRLSRRSVIIAGWVIYALVYLGFALATSVTHVWILFAVYGVFYALTEGVEKAFVADLVPENLRGTAFGLYHFVIGVAAFPASAVCGLLWQGYGSLAALGFGAALAAVASVLLLFVSEKRI